MAVAAAAAYLIFRTVRAIRRRRAACCGTSCPAAERPAGSNQPRFVSVDQIHVSAKQDNRR